MFPTTQQIDIYFRTLVANCDDLKALLGEAARNLNTIFESTDKPVPEAESLETA